MSIASLVAWLCLNAFLPEKTLFIVQKVDQNAISMTTPQEGDLILYFCNGDGCIGFPPRFITYPGGKDYLLPRLKPFIPKELL